MHTKLKILFKNEESECKHHCATVVAAGTIAGGDDGASNWRPARWLVPPLGPEGGGFTRVKTCSSTRAGGGGITAGRCCRPEAGRPAAAAVERSVVTASSSSNAAIMAGVVLPPRAMAGLVENVTRWVKCKRTQC